MSDKLTPNDKKTLSVIRYLTERHVIGELIPVVKKISEGDQAYFKGVVEMFEGACKFIEMSKKLE